MAHQFEDWQDVRQRYRDGEFVHQPLGGGGVRESRFYGESFIPREYVEREYGDRFDMVFASVTTKKGKARKQLIGAEAEYDQACFILRLRT